MEEGSDVQVNAPTLPHTSTLQHKDTMNSSTSAPVIPYFEKLVFQEKHEYAKVDCLLDRLISLFQTKQRKANLEVRFLQQLVDELKTTEPLGMKETVDALENVLQNVASRDPTFFHSLQGVGFPKHVSDSLNGHLLNAQQSLFRVSQVTFDALDTRKPSSVEEKALLLHIIDEKEPDMARIVCGAYATLTRLHLLFRLCPVLQPYFEQVQSAVNGKPDQSLYEELDRVMLGVYMVYVYLEEPVTSFAKSAFQYGARCLADDLETLLEESARARLEVLSSVLQWIRDTCGSTRYVKADVPVDPNVFREIEPAKAAQMLEKYNHRDLLFLRPEMRQYKETVDGFRFTASEYGNLRFKIYPSMRTLSGSGFLHPCSKTTTTSCTSWPPSSNKENSRVRNTSIWGTTQTEPLTFG